jgi:hypothetical protein
MCQGKYDEAEPLLREAVVITKKALGNNHADVAIDLNDLALVLRHQVSLCSELLLLKS